MQTHWLAVGGALSGRWFEFLRWAARWPYRADDPS